MKTQMGIAYAADETLTMPVHDGSEKNVCDTLSH